MAAWDDIAKAVLKQIGGKKNQKVRYEFAKKSGTLGAKNPSSKVTGKKAAERARAAVPKSSSGARQSKRKGTSTTGRPVGRIAKTKPERKGRDFISTKNTGIMKNDSQRRAANREANKFMRKNDPDGLRKPSGRGDDKMASDVKGSVIKPPSKATLRPPKPSRESYEADQMKRDFLKDIRSGLGSSGAKPKKKNVEPKKQAPARPKAEKKPASRANTRSEKSSSRPMGRQKPMSEADRKSKEKLVQKRQQERLADRKKKSRSDSKKPYDGWYDK